MYTNFHEALAHIIIKNSMFDDKYRNETKEITKKASENKRSIKNVKKKKGVKIITKIKRKERFKLFKKIRVNKNDIYK